MKYCVNLIGSLFYLLKEILNFVTFFTFLIFQVFPFLEIHNFQDFLGTLLFDILFWFLDLHGLICMDILLSEMSYLTFDFLQISIFILYNGSFILVISHFNGLSFFSRSSLFFLFLASKSLCCSVDSHSFFSAHSLVFLVWYILVGYSGKLWQVVDQLGSWMK